MLKKMFQIDSPDIVIKNVWANISKNSKIAFFSGMLSFIIFHFFALTNALFIHDATPILDMSTGIDNGRLLISLFMPLFNRISMPWLMGLFASIFVGLSIVFLSKIVNLKKPTSIVMCAIFISGFPVMVANNLYISSCYIYTFALFASIMCVYYADKNVVLSGIFLILSLCSYQAYVGVASTLLIIKLLCDMRDEKIAGKNVPLRALKYISILAVSMGLYYGLWKLALAISDIAVVDYRGYQNLTSLMTKNIGEHLIIAYASTLQGLFFNYFRLSTIPSFCFIFINAMAFILTDINFGKKNKNRVWMVLCFIAIPLSSSIIYMINPGILHLLMIFPYALPAILFISNVEHIKIQMPSMENIMKWVSLICVIVVVFSFVVMGNANYIKAKTQYDNSISYCTRFLDRIEQMEGFSKDTEIVVIAEVMDYGIYDNEEWSQSGKIFYHSDGNGAITYPQTFKWFMEYEMNTKLNITIGKTKDYIDIPEVKALSAFPSTNSFVWVGDVLVFKMM